MLNFILFFLIFYLGASWGSFLFLVYERRKLNQSIVYPQSSCDFCATPLPYYALFPIFSYLFSNRCCIFCDTKIPKTSFYSELSSGLVFLLINQQLLKNPLIFLSLLVLSYLAIEDLAVSEVGTSILIFPAFFILEFNFSFMKLFLFLILLLFLLNNFENLHIFSRFGQGDVEIIIFLALLFESEIVVRILFIASLLAIFSSTVQRRRSIPFVPYLFFAFILASPY